MANIPEETIRLAGRPKNSVLANDVASTRNDPRFYSAMQVLPNPDPILRKLGMANEVYEAIGYDAHVMGEIRAIRGGLLKNEWRLMPGGDKPKDIEAYELTKQVYEKPPAKSSSWSDVIWNMQSAVFRGFSVSEVVWKQFGNHIIPVKVEDKPNRRFVFDIDRELRLLTKENQHLGIEVPNYKFLLARHMQNYDNPHGVAVFSALFWAYTFKHNGFRWAAKFVERYGIPSPIGRYPLGTPLNDQKQLMDNLRAMIEDAVAVVPEGTGVELLTAPPGSHTPHLELINLCNREMSKALTSQTIGSEVTEAGSRSTGEVQQDRQTNNAESDLEMIQRTQQCLCDWIAELNFGPDVKPAKWQFYDEQDVSKSQAETMKITTGIAPVVKSEFYKKMQLTQPTDEDDVIFTGAQPVSDDSEFSANGKCTHTFTENQESELDRLARQGVDQSFRSIESIVNNVETLAGEVTDLDELEDRLAELVGKSDLSDLSSALENTNIIAHAIGLDDA
jgi:phage gp29-like protein